MTRGIAFANDLLQISKMQTEVEEMWHKYHNEPTNLTSKSL